MATNKVESHLMTNGRHHSFRKWRGLGPRDDSNNEWDNHICGGGALPPPLPIDENVGLQRLFQNVNAVHANVVPPLQEPNAPPPIELDNLPDMMANCEDPEFANHVMDVVQQAQTMVEDVQAQPDSIAEHDNVVAYNDGNEPLSAPDTPEMADQRTGPGDIPMDAVEDLNLTEVLLSCHPLFPGASVTKLAATMLIMIICTIHGVNNKFVDELLYLLSKYILPHPNSLPLNMYHARVLVEKVSHSYESIHACKNGCVLFQGDAYNDLTECPVYNANRFKACGRSQVPVSILRHFPLIPRLVRWYKSLRIAKMLRWAHLNKSSDGKMHGVHDSPTWRAIDTKFPSFARGFWNIRIALSADGFNPFSSLLYQWSTWPIFVFIYNLPP